MAGGDGGDGGDLKSLTEKYDWNPATKRKRKPVSPRSRKAQKKMKLKGDEMIASVLGDNRIEDVQWLCSLSESELEMLTCLKTMVLQRAKQNHPGFAAKIDLKMLRDLSFTMIKNLKEELKKDHLAPSCDCESVESWKLLDQSKLSQVGVEEEFSSMTIKELWPSIRPNTIGRPT